MSKKLSILIALAAVLLMADFADAAAAIRVRGRNNVVQVGGGAAVAARGRFVGGSRAAFVGDRFFVGRTAFIGGSYLTPNFASFQTLCASTAYVPPPPPPVITTSSFTTLQVQQTGLGGSFTEVDRFAPFGVGGRFTEFDRFRGVPLNTEVLRGGAMRGFSVLR